MRIRWTPTAADDLEHIKDYLTEHYPHLARSTVLELYEAIRSLKTFPQRGRPHFAVILSGPAWAIAAGVSGHTPG